MKAGFEETMNPAVADFEREKRRAFQRAKGMTNKQFWDWMTVMHSRAYELAQKHYGEAMDIVLTPKQKKSVLDKAQQICEVWDGLNGIEIDFSEMTLSDTLLEVQRMLSGASGSFSSLDEAQQELDETLTKFISALEQGDTNQTANKALNVIAVMVKLIRLKH